MYSTIMVPIDLEHTETLKKAVSTAADLGKLYKAEIVMVGVTDSVPGGVARSAGDYAKQLETYAATEGSRHNVTFTAKAVKSHDVPAELDSLLADTAAEIGADLIIMASHVPGLADYVFSSNAGYLASHSKLSVFVVR